MRRKRKGKEKGRGATETNRKKQKSMKFYDKIIIFTFVNNVFRLVR